MKKSDHVVDGAFGPSGSRIFGRQAAAGNASSDVESSARPDPRRGTPGAALPKVGVGQYVINLARKHGVSVVRTKLDVFAEAVTSHSGDDVQLDQVGQTLVALREKKLVTGQEMNRLMLGHIREKKRVRSLR